jgi:hypothetical protein
MSRLDLKKAEQFVGYPELMRIFQDWHAITEVDDDALEYLVKHSKVIWLPNVNHLSQNAITFLSSFRGHLKIGIPLK